ncbi:amidase [Rhodococcus sp. UNC363MFTsu5.1]|uniref:amidase n=1 Tax=Rhodococcus sp. UNC363MFTsu5.1 TaxID=1449069 RepID=UPI00047FA251|nr:amidase family protein [Rhodococcus sp. UNC363MFTsu5.1]
MDIGEYAAQDATGLAALIRDRQVSAAEVAAAAGEALDKIDPQLSAIAGERYETPLSHDENGVFAGVPFAIKDLIAHAEGVPTRSGSRLFGPGVTYPYDTYLMARFRRAGLATMATTTSPEFGFNATTEALAYGEPTRNPWDLTRSAGGSSGGSAALVAAGALPMAHANDGGGSIRIPAAACGAVGLKPSRGRITAGPDFADPLMGLGVEFAITRSVRDCAALFDAVHGSEPGDRYLFPEPERPFAEQARTGSRRLRIAFTTTPADPDRAVDAESAAAVRLVAQQLSELGHDVHEAAPSIDSAAFDRANLDAWCSFLGDAVTGAAAQLGLTPGREHLEATTLACVEYGKALSAFDIYAADRVFNTVTREVARFLTGFDVLLTPTTSGPTVPLGRLDADDTALDARGWYDRIFEYASFTALFNATGHPAISLPLAQSTQGWPIGMQFVGRYGDEGTLLALAGDLERAMPWADRHPPVSVY